MSDLFNALFNQEVNTDDDCEPLYTTVDVPDEINLPYTVVGQMTEEEYEEWGEKFRLTMLDLYDNHNMPPITKGCSRDVIIRKLQSFNNIEVIGNEKVHVRENGQNVYIGLNTWSNAVNHWFPEMADVAIGKGAKMKSIQPSIMEWFRNRERFMHISKMTIWKDRLKGFRDDPTLPMWPQVLQSIRVGGGNQPVVNIRGTVAKHIFQTEMLERCEKGQKDIVVYDPSMGWAGRMVGFLAACNHLELQYHTDSLTYIGTDPNTQIFDRYEKIERFWKKEINPSCKGKVIPVCSGSETFDETEVYQQYKGKVDIMFTSPPYFAKERYSQDETQSFKKFDGYPEWRDGFLGKTFENLYELLADDGVVYWNIADLKISKNKYLPLEDDSIAAAEAAGFELVEVCPMLMRYLIGRDSSSFIEAGNNVIQFGGVNRKTEPIFKFRKKQ